jgi:hypothetical protein
VPRECASKHRGFLQLGQPSWGTAESRHYWSVTQLSTDGGLPSAAMPCSHREVGPATAPRNRKALDDDRLASKLTRVRLLAFDQLRRHNRFVLRQEQELIARGSRSARTRVRRDLAIFDRLMQSPNDAQALEYRYRILRAFLLEREFTERLPSELRRRIGD